MGYTCSGFGRVMNENYSHAGPSFVLDYANVTRHPQFARAAVLIATSLHLVLGAAVLGFALVHFGTNAEEKDWRGIRHAIAAGVLAMFLFAAGFSLFARNDGGWRRAFVLLIAQRRRKFDHDGLLVACALDQSKQLSE